MKTTYLNDSPLTRAFSQTITFPEPETGERDCGLFVSVGIDDGVRDAYTKHLGAFFGVIEMPGHSVAKHQPENVFVLDGASLLKGDRSVVAMLPHLKAWMKKPFSFESGLDRSPITDVVEFARARKVFVVDDRTANLGQALVLLIGQQLLPVQGFANAMRAIERGGFDAVLTDLYLPPDKGYSSLSLDSYPLGAEVPAGMSIVFEATARGMPVAVVTNGNHHSDWFSAMFDRVGEATVNGQKVLFRNDPRKRWDQALEALVGNGA